MDSEEVDWRGLWDEAVQSTESGWSPWVDMGRSSNVHRARYHVDNWDLEVGFWPDSAASEKFYTYHSVAPYLWQSFQGAGSFGKWVWSILRRGGFSYSGPHDSPSD